MPRAREVERGMDACARSASARARGLRIKARLHHAPSITGNAAMPCADATSQGFAKFTNKRQNEVGRKYFPSCHQFAHILTTRKVALQYVPFLQMKAKAPNQPLGLTMQKSPNGRGGN